MIKKEANNVARLRRHARVRKSVSGTKECPRLDIFRSNKEIYAQVIDDVTGTTLASSSSLTLKLKNGGNVEAAKEVGKDIAKKCKELKIKTVALYSLSDCSKLHSIVLLVETAALYKFLVSASLLDAIAVENDYLVGAKDC